MNDNSDLPSLETISIGEDSFFKATSIEFNKLPNLTSFQTAHDSFKYVTQFTISEVPFLDGIYTHDGEDKKNPSDPPVTSATFTNLYGNQIIADSDNHPLKNQMIQAHNIHACPSGESLITLTLFSDTSFSMSWDIHLGLNASGIIVASGSSDTGAIQTISFDYCLSHDLYTIQFISGKGEFGRDASGYSLSVDQGEMKFEMNQFYGYNITATEIVYFSSYLPFQSEESLWSVYKNGLVAGWNTVAFDASGWESTRAATISNGVACTTYIRKEFDIPELDTYNVLNIRVKYQAGLVAYFNGNKVARFNLPETFNSTTRGVTFLEAPKYSKFHVILSSVGAVVGTNVIAFEVHAAEGQNLTSPVVFDATGVFGINDCSIVLDSVINVTGAEFGGNRNQYTLSSLEDLFNIQPDGYTLFAKAGMYLQWTVDNLEGSKFNSFAMATLSSNQWAFTLNAREHEFADDDPEAEDYSTIFTTESVVSVHRERVAVDVPNGMTGYRQFKYQVDTENTNIRVNEVLLQYCKPISEE